MKEWESGIVDLVMDDLSAVIDHEQTTLRSFPPGYFHHETYDQYDWPEARESHAIRSIMEHPMFDEHNSSHQFLEMS